MKLLRNQDGRLAGRPVYDLWRNHRQDFEQYQAIQRPKRRFPPNSHAASFVCDPDGRTVFAGLYYVEEARLATEAGSSPVEEARVQANGFIHTMKRLPLMERLEGELEIDWGRGYRAKKNTTSESLVAPSEVPEGSTYDPAASLLDQRQKTMQEVVARPGQDQFRVSLMGAYGKRCAVTGCSVPEVLEAARIIPYTGHASNHVCNGLLLRRDIHQLFDALLIAIEPESHSIVIAPRLRGTLHEKLVGRKIRLPKLANHHPSEVSLRSHQSRASL